MAQTELVQAQPITLPERASTSPGRKALRRFRRHRLAMLGVVIIVILVVAALVGNEPAALMPNLKLTNKPPSLEHPFGTDRTGRDVLARTLVGGRVSLSVGLVAVLFSTAIGTVLGALAGFYRGLVDQIIMRIVDMVMSGLLTWTTPCRIIRAQFLSLREKEYVEAARCLGKTDFDIAIKHILPNAIAPLLVYASFGVATAVLLEAGLSYLGLGVQPPTPSWGNMLNTARSISTMERTAWQWIPPAITTVMFVLAVNFVGDGIRDAVDPRALFEK